MKRPVPLVSIALALFTVAACAGDKSAATTDTSNVAGTPAPAPAAATAAPMATAMIVSPKDGDSTSHDVTVVLSEQNVTIAKADSKRVDGVGHYHLFLDTIPTALDTMPIPPTNKTVVHIGTGDSTYTFKGLTPGTHTIFAVIGYGNHVPMASVTDTVHFVVKK